MTTPQSPKEAVPGKFPFHECYILIEVDDDGEEHASFYSSPAARDKATLDAIWFGGPDECHKEEAEHYLAEIREKGFIAFEGDPPLIWRTMSDYVKQEHESALAEAVRRARGDGIRECIKALRELQETYCHQRKWNSSSVTTFAPVELSDWLVLNVLSRAAALSAGEEGNKDG
jgi:hypothetical protein